MRPDPANRSEEQVSRAFERFVDRRCSQSRYVLAHPVETISLLRAIRALPLLTARFSDDAQGTAIRVQLDRTWLRRHVLGGATAVLELPEHARDYTRGSSGSKYALRKRGRSARELGVRVDRVEAQERRTVLCAMADAHERADPRDAFRNEHADNADMLGHRFWFAAFVDDRPILLAVLPAEGEWAALRYFRTLEESEAATLSRYLMMQELVTARRADGIRRIVVGLGPHRLGNGVRRFQRMVGFRTVRLRVETVASRRSGVVAPRMIGHPGT